MNNDDPLMLEYIRFIEEITTATTEIFNPLLAILILSFISMPLFHLTYKRYCINYSHYTKIRIFRLFNQLHSIYHSLE